MNYTEQLASLEGTLKEKGYELRVKEYWKSKRGLPETVLYRKGHLYATIKRCYDNGYMIHADHTI